MGDEEEYLESVRKDNQQAQRLKRKKEKGKKGTKNKKSVAVATCFLGEGNKEIMRDTRLPVYLVQHLIRDSALGICFFILDKVSYTEGAIIFNNPVWYGHH